MCQTVSCSTNAPLPSYKNRIKHQLTDRCQKWFCQQSTAACWPVMTLTWQDDSAPSRYTSEHHGDRPAEVSASLIFHLILLTWIIAAYHKIITGYNYQKTHSKVQNWCFHLCDGVNLSFLQLNKHNSVDLFFDWLTIIVLKLVIKFYAVTKISHIKFEPPCVWVRFL